MKGSATIALAAVCFAVLLVWRSRPPAPTAVHLAPPDARPTPTAALAVSGSSSADETGEKNRILDEIFHTRNDNDPRLDTDFNDLSPETRRAFRKKYRALVPERRNDRGIILYLLGKNLRTVEDWAILREAVAEPPCLSFSDCSRPPAPEEGEGATGDAVTLAYPALVALKQAEHALLNRDAGARREALSVLRAARGSRAEIVARKAGELAGRFKITTEPGQSK